MTPIQVSRRRSNRICQGDVFRDIQFIEYVEERRGTIEVSKIEFPLVVVLTQDCDLEQELGGREKATHDKRLFSVLVAPLYNAEHVYAGEHLSELNAAMASINKNKSPGETLRQNERPRYHYLQFPDDVAIVPSILDFKHYFSVNLSYLERNRSKQFVCRLGTLFREDLSQRFAAYLARIGLPEPPRGRPAVQVAAAAG